MTDQTMNKEIKWDCGTITEKCTVIEKAIEDLIAVKQLYIKTRDDIQENWQGDAAQAYLTSMCLDMSDIEKLTENLTLLTTTLKSAVTTYSRCEESVTQDFDNAGARLESLNVKNITEF